MNSFAEEVHLLPVAKGVSKFKWHILKSCCVSSKAAHLILLWNFAILLMYVLFTVNSLVKFKGYYDPPAIIVGLSITAVFAPMAGLLTDLKYHDIATVFTESYC